MTIDILEVTTTTETEAQAQQLAKTLIEQRLAACVQIDGPIQSIYHWQGQVCDAAEFRCTVKSTRQLGPQLIECIRQHHPYETPEILLNEVSVSDEYGQWLHAQVVAAAGQ